MRKAKNLCARLITQQIDSLDEDQRYDILAELEDIGIDLDDDINTYLPFSVRNPNFPTTPITLRTLMSHTSSINDWWDTLHVVRTWGGRSRNSPGFLYG